MRGLGFAEDDLDRPLGTFSGGEVTRASLARVLSGKPDLLLLDEPTNHFDVQNLEWLERELETVDAAVILVAHDRWFLEAVTTSVLELGPARAHYFAGPWHEWRREKAARAVAAEKTVGRVADDIERLERFVTRFRYKKSKAKQAQAKLTQIGRLEQERSRAAEELAALTRKRRTLGFDFLRPPRTGRVVLEAEGVTLSAGDKLLLEDASFAVERGEKIGARRPERQREDDPAPRVARRAPARPRHCPPRARRYPRLLLPAHARAALAGVGARLRGSRRPGCRGRRHRCSSAASSSPAGRRTSGP